MIAAGLTDSYAVIAADSALEDGETLTYETPKMFVLDKYVFTYIGYVDYFSELDKAKFSLSFAALCVYLENYLKRQKEYVQQVLVDKGLFDGKVPGLCVFILGIYNGKPTLAQFNSLKDFVPEFLVGNEIVQFSDIYYEVNDENYFKNSRDYMDQLAFDYKNFLSPGIIAEILTKGIYHKADQEFKKDGKKYAGGAVSVVAMELNEKIKPLSHAHI